MITAIASLAFAVAMVAALAMGFAIQRGSICMVAALGELLQERRASRLLAIVQAAIWVGGLLSLASLAGSAGMGEASYSPTRWTLMGGALLGVGAFVNQGCAFGAIARFGSGDWSYFLTPVGLFFGTILAELALSPGMLLSNPTPYKIGGASRWLFLAPCVLLGLRLLAACGRSIRSRDLRAPWNPATATAVIGASFGILYLAVGSWSYTNAIALLATGMDFDVLARLILFGAVLVGALIGGRIAGKTATGFPPIRSIVRCFLGGAMMGTGGSLIPGSNDALLLVGMPLLQPHALLATIAMIATIAACFIVMALRSIVVARRVRLDSSM